MSNFQVNKRPSNKGDRDTLRLKGGQIYFSLNSYSGKQGEFIIYYVPSLKISGYGKTAEEAEEFLKIEIQVFCEDVLKMPIKEKEAFLASLGFEKEKFRSKNFSKAYVDENGMLKEFEEGTVERRILQMTA